MKLQHKHVILLRHGAWIVPAIVTLPVLGIAIWLSTRSPGYATYTTANLGDAHHTALRLQYPADWEARPQTMLGTIQTVTLHPRPATGLQGWLAGHGIRFVSGEQNYSNVFIIVYPGGTE